MRSGPRNAVPSQEKRDECTVTVFPSGYYNNLRQESESRTAANYGPAYPRLVQLKNAYDPGNLFRLNANIKPTV